MLANKHLLGSSTSVVHDNPCLDTTYTCAFKPECLMSHSWLHTPDCEVSNGKKEMKECVQVGVSIFMPPATA